MGLGDFFSGGVQAGTQMTLYSVLTVLTVRVALAVYSTAIFAISAN